MKHPEGSRFERRLKARQRRREIEALLAEKSVVDLLAEARRQTSMTPEEINDWLKRSGITRKTRQRNDRRR